MRSHPYTGNGAKKPMLYFYLALFSVAVASFIEYLAPEVFDKVSELLSLSPDTNFIVSVAPFVVFGLLNVLFSHVFWRIPIAQRYFGVPDISGDWKVVGKTVADDHGEKHEWEAKVSIEQSFENILITLKTSQSGSHSLSASFKKRTSSSYELDYLYENEPRPGEVELSRHTGAAHLIFDLDSNQAEGHYFNGRGRKSYGEFYWEKV